MHVANVRTDAAGNARLPSPIPTPTQPYLTATATNEAGSTSEFSRCLAVTPDFGLSATPASVAVGPGQNASYVVTVSPIGIPITSTVTFSCTGLPASASCAFSPASLVPGAASATTTLTITTGSAAASAAQVFPLLPISRGWAGTALLASLGLLALAIVPGRRRSIAVAALMIGLGAWACGGGDGTAPEEDEPPASAVTHTVTVNATAGPVSRSTAVTLVINAR
jgi:hypothetical protein